MHTQVFVAINASSGENTDELVGISKKNGQIVLAFKKPAPQTHFAVHSSSLAITDGSPMAKAFIDAHNAARALHDAAPLTWDNELAASSQKWASACVDEHASGLGNVGENLYFAASGAKFNLEDPALAKKAVTSWYSEEADWNYATSAGKGTGSTGHFTQVVWKSTTKLGCGVASCPNIESMGKWADVLYIVCRYTPAGNWDGQYAANVPKKTGGSAQPAAGSAPPAAGSAPPAAGSPKPVDDDDDDDDAPKKKKKKGPKPM